MSTSSFHILSAVVCFWPVIANLKQDSLCLLQAGASVVKGTDDGMIADDGPEDWLNFVFGQAKDGASHQEETVVNVSGSTAPLTEEGYQQVAAMSDNEQMRSYVHRVAAGEGLMTTNQGQLSGVVPWYSGKVSTQTLSALKHELHSKEFMVKTSEFAASPAANLGAMGLDFYVEEVQRIRHKFYLYSLPEFEPRFQGSLADCDRKGADYMFIEQLRAHRDRVIDPGQADLFVVPCLFESYRRCTTTNHAEKPPTLLAEMHPKEGGHTVRVSNNNISSLIRRHSMFRDNELFPKDVPHPEDFEDIPWKIPFDTDTQTCLDKVMATQSFKANGGADHLWIVADWTMNFGRTCESELFKNMTIGRIEAVDNNAASYSNRPKAVEQSRCSFVVPFASDLAYVESWEDTTSFEDWLKRPHTVTFRFEDRQYVLFCKADPCPGAPDSTHLRRQSLEFARLFDSGANIAMQRVPIAQFVEEMHGTKFCLVIRGDTASSHSFYDALAASCIPILISDEWEAFAGPFSQGEHGVLHGGMLANEYTIKIPEKLWMTDLSSVKAQIDNVLNDVDTLRQLFNNMQAHRRVLLWSMPQNTVADFALHSAKQCSEPQRMQ